MTSIGETNPSANPVDIPIKDLQQAEGENTFSNDRESSAISHGGTTVGDDVGAGVVGEGVVGEDVGLTVGAKVGDKEGIKEGEIEGDIVGGSGLTSALPETAMMLPLLGSEHLIQFLNRFSSFNHDSWRRLCCCRGGSCSERLRQRKRAMMFFTIALAIVGIR